MLKIRVTISVGSLGKQRRWRKGKTKGNTKRQKREQPSKKVREERKEGPECEGDNSFHSWHISLLLLLSWKR